MNIGVSLPTYGNDGWRFPTGTLQRYVNQIEEAGFGGIWVMEHLTRPGDWSYNRLDPLTTLASVAGATERIPIGTSVLLLPLRQPVLAAHRAATLQHLSDDRLTLGLGIGWSEKEYAAASVPFEERGPRFTEALELLYRLFHEDRVTFEGKFYSVQNFRLEPPTPRPPKILVGGGAIERDGERRVPRAVKQRILNYADGWIARPELPSAIESDWKKIAAYLEENGRDPTTLDRVALQRAYVVPNVDSALAREKQRRVYGVKSDAESAMKNFLIGDVEEIRDGLSKYRELGFDELILDCVTNDPTDAEEQLRRYEEYLSDFI